MSRYHSRAAYSAFGRSPDSGHKATTLTETGDRSPHGFGYLNTGTGTKRVNENILMQANAAPYIQEGAGDNTSQCKQAYDSFMGMRKSRLYTEDDNKAVDENRQNRQQAVMRLKGEVF